jgi:inorganic pyrophosphatase/exopolyphosphatase
MIKDAFGIKTFKQGTFLPKVVSRKKQMLPSILSILEGE